MAASAHRTIHRRNFALRIVPFALIASVSAFVVASQLRANPATTTGPDYSDLVLNLTFDNDSGSTVTDSSKYQHNGTATGTTVTDGKFGNGRSFNGSSDRIVIPHADALSPTGAITVEAWVYLDTANDSMKIFQKRGVFTDTAGGYMLGAWFGNPRGYGFEVYDSSQHLVNTSPERLPTTQAWTHVAATYDGSNLKLYENGQLVGTTAWSGAITRSTKDLYIGTQPDNFLMPFKGKMDEIRIYNRALSAEEVSCSYEGKVWVSGSCQSTVPNRSPVVVSMSGSTALEAGVQGMWTVKVYDPDGGRLVHSVDWGDGGARAMDGEVTNGAGHLTTTFAHSYASAGTYTPTVTVTDPSGLSSAAFAASSVTIAAPTTRVSGGIYEATTWTKARSPYVVSDDVTVFPGVTLTIEPGVEVRFADSKRLAIRGNLVAEGTSSDRITFTADRSSPAKGAWSGIQIENQQGGKASLKFTTIQYASSALSVECCHSGGPVTVADATIRESATGFGGYAGWKARVDRTVFENNTRAVTNADKEIYDSTFRNNTYGLDQTERISVYRSTFTGHTIAAWGGRGDFKQNTVTNNETGIQAFFEGWKTTYNTITGNGVGIVIGQYDSTVPEISYNNIHSNTTYDAKVTGASNKTAANNWWGTTDTSAIDAKVYDGRDNTSLGLLTYQPVQSQAVDIVNLVVPDTQAPGIPTQLVGESSMLTSASLSWLAPSDNVGVTSYQVRYRQGTSFADVDWANATVISTVSSTVAAGQRVSTVIYNLTAGTDYAAGVKACDAAGNCSTIAAATFRTLGETQTGGANGIIGHWKFDGSGNNEVSGGPSAATVGGATFRSDGGKIGGYAYIPAAGDSVKIPYRSAFDLPNTLTVAFWFRQRADRGALQDLVVKGSGLNNYNFRIFRQLWNQYNFGPIISGYTSSRTGYWTQTSNPNQLSHNQWHHVVFTKDATRSAYYLDGTLTHESQQTDPAKTPAHDIVIGQTAVDTDFDDLRIYNRALSASEARDLGGFPALDTQVPGLPTNVTAEETTMTSTRIAWLAPSDNVGVTSYQVRYRQGTSFANVDWDGATSTGSIPSTVAAGQRVSTVFSNLSASTDYGVGVKACDAANNCSTIAAATFRTQGTTTTGTNTNTSTSTSTTGTGTGTGTTTTGTGTTTTTTTGTGTTTTTTGTATTTTGTTTTGTGTTTSTTGTTTSSGGGGGTTTTTTTTGTATLRVTVRDAASQSVSGAFVGLSFPGGGAASPTTTTGVDGIAAFSNIAAGSYHLGVSPPTTRADLGSIASQPVALALSSTTDLAVSLPVRTTTTDVTGGTTANAAALCGTVYDPDRNILSGITIGLSRGGGDMALLGTSALTGADGRYCFANLAPGTYVIGAMTPAHRTDLSPQAPAVVTLAAGTSGTQDLVFGRASFVATPGVPPPAPPPTAPPPLPVIERCVRDAFGPELYDRMRIGKYKPKKEEYERARHCFNLTVIADHRPTETPIGAPVIPTPSVIVIQGPAVPPPTARPPEFDDRCEARELPRVKRGLQRIGRELTTIEREITRLQTAKVTVPIDTGLLIARARDLLKQVQDAKTCEDAFTAGEELPELLQQLRMSIERVSRLRFAPRVLTSFDREVKRFLDRTRVSIRRLERAKFAVAEFRSRFAEAEQQLKECRSSAQSALTAVDPELFEDTVRSCFEILDEAREIQSLTDALANARSFLTGQVNVTLRKAARVARDLERQKKDASEVKQFADALKQRRDEALTALRAGGLAKEELVDLMEEVITAFGDLDDAFERALGTSTYEEIVGKAPPPSIVAPKLEKPTEEFFERE